ncbi:MAG: rhodanese-like domain-containing protein [Erysipelotrichaceae bacterium]|nr:rhodanese-like domain-containing protein [Erysipelotrichaceae bacterium]
MRKLAITMGLLSLLMGCTKTQSENITIIDSKTAYEMMQNEEVTIIDVRTKEEYEDGHILNAINLDVSYIGNTIPTELPNLDSKILIYCRSGSRSNQAALKLEKLGYTNLYDFGGLNSWPYEIVK